MALAVLKGTAYATIDHLKTIILRADSRTYEDKFQKMFDALRHIKDPAKRQNALQSIEHACKHVEDDLPNEIKEQLNIEQIKSWLIERVDDLGKHPEEGQPKKKKGYWPTHSSKQHSDLRNKIQEIVAITDQAALSSFVSQALENPRFKKIAQDCQKESLYQQIVSHDRSKGRKISL